MWTFFNIIAVILLLAKWQQVQSFMISRTPVVLKTRDNMNKGTKFVLHDTPPERDFKDLLKIPELPVEKKGELQLPQSAPLIGAGLLAAFAALTFGMRGNIDKMAKEGGSDAKVAEPEPEPIDVSIPYDAAARLAYDEWRDVNNKGDFDADGYAAFKAIYEELTVANVIAKKKARDLMSLKNGKAEEAVSAKEKVSDKVFFAEEA